MSELVNSVVKCIGLRGEAYKPFVVHIYAKRVKACNKDINPEVELIPLDQIWVIQVPGHNHAFPIRYLLHVVYEVDSLALRGVSWLDNPQPIFSPKHIC
jgi:hypothetical protein